MPHVSRSMEGQFAANGILWGEGARMEKVRIRLIGQSKAELDYERGESGRTCWRSSRVSKHRESDVASPAWMAKLTPFSRTVAPKGTAVPRSGGACIEALIGERNRRGATWWGERGAKEEGLV